MKQLSEDLHRWKNRKKENSITGTAILIGGHHRAVAVRGGVRVLVHAEAMGSGHRGIMGAYLEGLPLQTKPLFRLNQTPALLIHSNQAAVVFRHVLQHNEPQSVPQASRYTHNNQHFSQPSSCTGDGRVVCISTKGVKRCALTWQWKYWKFVMLQKISILNKFFWVSIQSILKENIKQQNCF